MAQSIRDKDVCIKSGDPIALTISTDGDVQAVIGETAIFMIKTRPTDDDVDAILSKDIDIIIDGEIPVYVPSTETEVLANGSYYWSVKHKKATDSYTIIPDSEDLTCGKYPTFVIGGALING